MFHFYLFTQLIFIDEMLVHRCIPQFPDYVHETIAHFVPQNILDKHMKSGNWQNKKLSRGDEKMEEKLSTIKRSL